MARQPPRAYELEQWATRNLMSSHCLCGARKERRNPFCLECYLPLPEPMKKLLHTTLKNGFAAYFRNAVFWLQTNTERFRRPPVRPA